MKKGLLLVLLSAVLMFGMSAASVFAADGNVAKIGNQEYASLNEAVKAAKAGETVELIADTTVTEQISVTGKAVTIKGNHEIKSGVEDIFEAGSRGVITLSKGLTVHSDSSALAAIDGGVINVAGTNIIGYGKDPYTLAATIDAGSQINISAGSLVQKGLQNYTLSAEEGASVLITGGTVGNEHFSCMTSSGEGSVITVKDGDIYSHCDNTSYINNDARDGGKLIVEGGTFRGNNTTTIAALIMDGTKGGTVEVRGGRIARGVDAYHDPSSSVRISGGEIGYELKKDECGVYVSQGALCEITGGVIHGTIGTRTADSGVLRISGGTFDNVPSKYGEALNNAAYAAVFQTDRPYYAVGNDIGKAVKDENNLVIIKQGNIALTDAKAMIMNVGTGVVTADGRTVPATTGAAGEAIAKIAFLLDELILAEPAAIADARASYDALTAEEKALVPDVVLQKLERLEHLVAADATTEISKVKNVKGKKATVEWTAPIIHSQFPEAIVSGFYIAYSTDKKFKKNVKTKKVTDPSARELTVKKLKKGKTYYFRVCTYTEVKNTPISEPTSVRGKWSAKKKVKITK